MRYRSLDSDYDMKFGKSQADFYRDVPEAPAQAVLTRLMLFSGEWYADLREGTPWQTKVLGKRTANTRDPVVRARIFGTPGVKAIVDYGSVLNRDTRGWSFNAQIDTIYGAATVEGPL